MGWAIDLDGVVWLAHNPIPGAAAAIERLRAAGERVLFVTNNAQYERGVVAGHLRSVGIDASAADVLTSALAVAGLVDRGERVLTFAGAGVREALAERGAEIVDPYDPVPRGGGNDVDTVVVGRHTEMTFAALTSAVRAVVNGARLVATNTDPAYPTPHGPEPGAGALLAAVETASGRQACVVAGKPHEAMVQLVTDRLGPGGWVVGDAPHTDGRLAHQLGYRFGLVLSGVTSHADLPVVPTPDVVAADLGALVDVVLGGY